MEMVTAYLSSAAIEGPLKGAVDELLRLHKEMANTEQQIETTREQMAEYRARMDELHAQIVTLKAGEDGRAADAEPGEEARGGERQGSPRRRSTS